MPENILFLTGTRAEFGKLKSLIKQIDLSDEFECSLFVTGMHTLSRYGYTVDEVYKSIGEHRLSQGFRNVYVYMNQVSGDPMDRILANTINGLSRYVEEFKPDLIVVHGDRVEALAGAIVGSLRNILVAHIEGGEISGTIDEIIRHAITKMSHIHFVANEEAANRLKQLGETPESIYIIGSPDIDIMLSPDLPAIEKVKAYYEIPFDKYAIVLFHPVTTDLEGTQKSVESLVSALLESDKNYIVIHPNNDEGCELIFREYERLKDNSRFVIYPSMRIEYFLSLLKHADFIVGNSSAGIREAPVYGVYSINIESRQMKRFTYQSIINVTGKKADLKNAIDELKTEIHCEPSLHFGNGESVKLFITALKDKRLWKTSKQKQFVDIPFSNIMNQLQKE